MMWGVSKRHLTLDFVHGLVLPAPDPMRSETPTPRGPRTIVGHFADPHKGHSSRGGNLIWTAAYFLFLCFWNSRFLGFGRCSYCSPTCLPVDGIICECLSRCSLYLLKLNIRDLIFSRIKIWISRRTGRCQRFAFRINIALVPAYGRFVINN